MRRAVIAIAAAATFAACGVVADGPTTSTGPLFSYLAGDAPDVPGLDAVAVEAGSALYTRYCAICHGVDLEGEVDWKERNPDGTFKAPPHDDSGHTWHHSDRVLLEVIMAGSSEESRMPGYASVLTDEQVGSIIEYFKSTWSDESRRFQWQVTWQDQQVE